MNTPDPTPHRPRQERLQQEGQAEGGGDSGNELELADESYDTLQFKEPVLELSQA